MRLSSKSDCCDSNSENESHSGNENLTANASLAKKHKYLNKDVVYTRVFYSSFVNKKNASSLLARGNKVRTMNRSHVKSNVEPQ